MALADRKLTDLTEKVTAPDNSWIHIVDPSDISQSPEGSSFKVKKSNFGGLSDAPIDGEQYARQNGVWSIVSSGIITTEYTLLSSALTTQDLAGIVSYINALSPVVVVAANETAIWRVNDTGQIFELKLHGVTVGLAQTPILTTDILEIEPLRELPRSREIKWWAQGGTLATTLTVQGGLVNSPVLYTGTKVNPTTVVYSNTMTTSVPRLVYQTAASAGSSSGFKAGQGSVFPFSTSTGYNLRILFDTSDLASIATSRISCGVHATAFDIGNVNPSTLLNCILVGNDTGDTNLWLMHNDSSGTCTRVDLGANFPHNTINCFYELYIEFKPNATAVHWVLNRYQNTPILSTPIFTAKGVITSNFPGGSAPQAWFIHRDNDTTAAATQVGVSYVDAKIFY